MEKEDAEKLSLHIIKINSMLDESVAFVLDHDPSGVLKDYRKTAGKLMGSLLVDVANRIWAEHPDLKPKQMGGPYVVDDSVFEPRLYNPKDEN